MSTGAFLGGYLLVWTAFSLVATLLQWGLDQAALLSSMMVTTSPMLGAGILIAAGILSIRTGALPKWLGWAGLVVALGLLIARAFWERSRGSVRAHRLFLAVDDYDQRGPDSPRRKTRRICSAEGKSR